jgi:hypothetical protein
MCGVCGSIYSVVLCWQAFVRNGAKSCKSYFGYVLREQKGKKLMICRLIDSLLRRFSFYFVISLDFSSYRVYANMAILSFDLFFCHMIRVMWCFIALFACRRNDASGLITCAAINRK